MSAATLELPQQKADVAPSAELWYISINGHASRNWPKDWTWGQIIQRLEDVTATPTPEQLWDMRVIGEALGHVKFRPTQVKAMTDHRLRRVQTALKLWGSILIRDMQFKAQRHQVAMAVRRQLERLGQRV